MVNSFNAMTSGGATTPGSLDRLGQRSGVSGYDERNALDAAVAAMRRSAGRPEGEVCRPRGDGGRYLLVSATSHR
jgi:hypothetical protein